MKQKVFVGEVVSIAEIVKLKLDDGSGYAFMPIIALSEGRILKVGDRILVRIKKRDADDTGEWEIRVLEKSAHIAGKGESPFFKERIDPSKKK